MRFGCGIGYFYQLKLKHANINKPDPIYDYEVF